MQGKWSKGRRGDPASPLCFPHIEFLCSPFVSSLSSLIWDIDLLIKTKRVGGSHHPSRDRDAQFAPLICLLIVDLAQVADGIDKSGCH